MPALPVPGPIVRLNMHFSQSGSPNCLNRIFIHFTGTAPTSAQLATFADAAQSAWASAQGSNQGTGTTSGPFSAQDLSNPAGAFGQGTTTHTGTRVGALVAAGQCVNIRYNIARHYRGGKPKGYFNLGSASDLQTNATWQAAFITSVATAWNTYIAAVLAAGWTGAGTLEHRNVSWYQGFHVVTDPVTGRARNVNDLRAVPVHEAITGYSVDNQVGSQRRRNLNN